jgi:hypothetical protein
MTCQAGHGRELGPRDHQRLTLALATVAAALIALATAAATAGAVVRAAVTIDGPSGNIVTLGGVAMAPDGTGGLVYVKVDQGEPHVFVSQFVGGQWQPPQRVDTGLPFDSSWPQIGAGDGGRLVVVWAQSFAKDPLGVPLRRMYSATLKPGSSTFLPQIAIDSNLANPPNASGDEGVSELFPSLSMDAIGQAYLVYRVVTNACDTSCANPRQGTIFRPGDAFADFRLARFNGETWSVLGAINRNTAFSVRPGTVDNSPQVTTDATGKGVVAFQEPDNSGYDRIWARRLFGRSIGQILRASPSTYNGQPVNGDADAFSLAGTDNGGALIAYRQQAPAAQLAAGPREFENELFPASAPQSGQFVGARVIDQSAVDIGSPAAAMNDLASFGAAYTKNSAMQFASGNSSGLHGMSSLGAAAGIDRPGLTIGSDGFAVSAWAAADTFGQPIVDVEQLPRAGHPSRGQVAALAGGPLNDLTLGGSGQGDALVAFRQGVAAGTQIAATVVQAPPPQVAVQAPSNYVKPTKAVFTWEPPPRALGTITYSPVVDGVVRARGLTRTSYRIDPRGLQTGSYDVAVIATDNAGQQTLSFHDTLHVDASPQAAVSRKGREVAIRVSDGRPGHSPGLDLRHTTVRFGDGSPAARMHGGRRAKAAVTFRHRFRHAGLFRIGVHARSRAGFSRTLELRVRVS